MLLRTRNEVLLELISANSKISYIQGLERCLRRSRVCRALANDQWKIESEANHSHKSRQAKPKHIFLAIMAVKKNTGVATTVDTKKTGKQEGPVVVEQTKENPAVKKADKHNHELEQSRNSKISLVKVDTKITNGTSNKKKEDLSLLELSIKASATAKAAKGKKPGKGDKKNSD